MVKSIAKTDEGTFRSTPTVHPMERKKKLIDADAQHNSSIFISNENRELVLSSANRLPLRTLNHNKRPTKLKGASDRKLRSVKRVWGAFKSRLNPKPRWKPSDRWAATLASPNTPTTRQQMINSPLTPLTQQNTRYSGTESDRWTAYRNFNNKTPGTPSSPKSPYKRQQRKSVRIAEKQQQMPERDISPGFSRTPQNEATSSCSPYGEPDSPANVSTMSLDASAVFREVIDRMGALNEGLATFEKMGTSLDESIKANDSKEEVSEEAKPTKSLRRQSSSFLRRRSLRLQSP